MYDVSGKSVEDIINISKSTLNDLTPRELRQVTSRLVSAVNKRIRRLENYAKKHNIELPSLTALHRQGLQKFSIKGVSDDKVLNVYEDIKKFLDYKTGSVSGYKKFRKELDAKTDAAVDFDYTSLDEEEKNNIWELYDEIKERYAGLFEIMKSKGKGTNGIVVQAIYNLKDKLSKDEVIERVSDLVENMYQKETTDEGFKEYLQQEFSIVK